MKYTFLISVALALASSGCIGSGATAPTTQKFSDANAALLADINAAAASAGVVAQDYAALKVAQATAENALKTPTTTTKP